MVLIGEGTFLLDSPSVERSELRRYGQQLFASFDHAASYLPLDDFGLELDIEQGSLKGKTAILASLPIIYIGIGNFGDFVQGVRELSNITRSVVDMVAQDAPKAARLPQSALKSKRAEAGKLGKLNRLFEAVARGDLTPEEATLSALALFPSDEEIPPEFVRDLERAAKGVRRQPEQLPLLELRPDSPLIPQPPSSPRGHRETPIAPGPSERLRVEIRRDHIRSKTTMRVVRLRNKRKGS